MQLKINIQRTFCIKCLGSYQASNSYRSPIRFLLLKFELKELVQGWDEQIMCSAHIVAHMVKFLETLQYKTSSIDYILWKTPIPRTNCLVDHVWISEYTYLTPIWRSNIVELIFGVFLSLFSWLFPNQPSQITNKWMLHQLDVATALGWLMDITV